MTPAERKKFLKFVDKCAKEVAKWPAWMKGKCNPKIKVSK